MTRLTAIVLMPPDDQHPKPWRRQIEIHPSATREARRAKVPPPIPALAELRGVPRVEVAPPKRPRGFAGGCQWWALKLEDLRLRRQRNAAKAAPTADERRRANRRARKAIKRRVYLDRLAAIALEAKLDQWQNGNTRWAP